MGPIVLLTDFGSRDWFAGVLKGVIAGIAPKAQVIDLNHGIPPGDVRAGAFNLWAARDYFPKGSIFVAVVDPGVGSARKGLLVRAHGRFFIGPDNGLLSWATSGDPRRAVRALENPRFRLASVSSSFHGRDVFAPAAAHLAKGAEPAGFGPSLRSIVELPPIASRRAGRSLVGEVIYLDTFGNAVTSLSAADVAALGHAPAYAQSGARKFPFKRFYAEAAPGKPLSLMGSCGLLELSRNGDAAKLRLGDRVELA